MQDRDVLNVIHRALVIALVNGSAPTLKRVIRETDHGLYDLTITVQDGAKEQDFILSSNDLTEVPVIEVVPETSVPAPLPALPVELDDSLHE